jgi:hypothetical protein
MWSRALVAGHMLIWMVLSLYAFIAAAQNKSASCWTMVPSFFFLPLLTIAILSFPYFAIWVFRPSQRPQLPFLLACHGVILTTGLAGSIFAAVKAAGPVYCL